MYGVQVTKKLVEVIVLLWEEYYVKPKEFDLTGNVGERNLQVAAGFVPVYCSKTTRPVGGTPTCKTTYSAPASLLSSAAK